MLKESNPELDILLNRFKNHLEKENLGQALLIHGEIKDKEIHFILSYLAKALLCQNNNQKPCGSCQACFLIDSSKHPDFHEIKPEKKMAAIKIDTIRELSQIIYQSSQLGQNRLIFINKADKLNTAASNALLKILEEPPENVYFILYAKQLRELLPTILSRCQLWAISSLSIDFENFKTIDYLFDDSDERKESPALMEDMLDDLKAMLTNQLSLCLVAQRWNQYDFPLICQLFYWLTAGLIYQIVGKEGSHSSLASLVPLVNLTQLFRVLDELNLINQRINQSIHLNSLLALENLLILFSFNDKL